MGTRTSIITNNTAWDNCIFKPSMIHIILKCNYVCYYDSWEKLSYDNGSDRCSFNISLEKNAIKNKYLIIQVSTMSSKTIMQDMKSNEFKWNMFFILFPK